MRYVGNTNISTKESLFFCPFIIESMFRSRLTVPRPTSLHEVSL
jgi:hypothetical protein